MWQDNDPIDFKGEKTIDVERSVFVLGSFGKYQNWVEELMGRISRAKRERRAKGTRSHAMERRDKSNGRWLQQSGLSIGTELADFTAAAESGDLDLIRRRLIATHNVRMEGCGSLPAAYNAECWSALNNLVFSYVALRRAGYDMNAHPAHFSSWPGELRWALDAIQQSVRLLLCGQITGAALLARTQLERWTENRAYNARVQRRDGETMEAFAERVWMQPIFGTFGGGLDKESIARDGRTISPYHVMRELHMIAHGEQYMEVVDWSNRGFSDMPMSAVNAARVVADALFLAAAQVRNCVIQFLTDGGHEQESSLLKALRFMPVIPKYSISPLKPALWPVNLVLIKGGPWIPVQEMASKFDGVLDGERPDGRLYNDAEMTALSFHYYRNRAIRWSNDAFEREALIVGPLNKNSLDAMETPNIVTGEMAAAVASWLAAGNPVRAAAATISDALRSSFWLWLEDDTRAMAVLRVVLEQTARLRVWRLKPHDAAKLEVKGNPVSWLKKAGWGRLRPLNKALGELVHYRPEANWEGAYDLLVLLNVGATQDEAPFTARRHALETVTRLASKELRETARIISPPNWQCF